MLLILRTIFKMATFFNKIVMLLYNTYIFLQWLTWMKDGYICRFVINAHKSFFLSNYEKAFLPCRSKVNRSKHRTHVWYWSVNYNGMIHILLSKYTHRVEPKPYFVNGISTLNDSTNGNSAQSFVAEMNDASIIKRVGW